LLELFRRLLICSRYEKTFADIPTEIVDEILLVDDSSHDKTLKLCHRLGIRCFLHDRNLGYGRNQKTCYKEALDIGADIVVMLHPDYQYSPKIIPALTGLVASEEYDVAIGSRILGGKARSGGMPLYKYIANRFLTAFQNLLIGAKLSEYHTGFRAFSRRVLETLPLLENSDDFVFDNEMLTQVIYFGFRVGEVSCPTRYFSEASSINFLRSVKYGLGVLVNSLKFFFQKLGLLRFRIFNKVGHGLSFSSYYIESQSSSVEKLLENDGISREYQASSLGSPRLGLHLTESCRLKTPTEEICCEDRIDEYSGQR
jgi:glycosyltransferase involved in cell wall biosynthesis